MKKDYLGDGVYITPGNYMGEIVLTSENGISVLDRIILGPHELAALNRYLARWLAEAKDDVSKG